MRRVDLGPVRLGPRESARKELIRVAESCGLRVTMMGTLAGTPGCVHVHLKQSKRPGTLELTYLPADGSMWASVSSSREAAWIDPAIAEICRRLKPFAGDSTQPRRRGTESMKPISDLPSLLRELSPTLRKGTFVFCCVPEGATVDPEQCLATFREDEGLSVIVSEEFARRAGLRPMFRGEWLSLGVCSDLASVGLIAAISGALESAGIACNVVGATFHDHLFVPAGRGKAALAVLDGLSRGAGGTGKAMKDRPAVNKRRPRHDRPVPQQRPTGRKSGSRSPKSGK